MYGYYRMNVDGFVGGLIRSNIGRVINCLVCCPSDSFAKRPFAINEFSQILLSRRERLGKDKSPFLMGECNCKTFSETLL